MFPFLASTTNEEHTKKQDYMISKENKRPVLVILTELEYTEDNNIQ